MVAYVFDNILTQGIRAGQVPARTADARNWFRDQAATTTVTPSSLISKNRGKQVGRTGVGSMYLFNYDPKHKATLPYYDRFPLVFMIEDYNDGFLGINLHYLPPRLRAQLMDALYSLSSNQRYDENTKLRISYEILKSAAKYRYFKPCVKRYLTSQVKSRYLLIDPVEWDIALFLPTQRFSKKSADFVWGESRKAV